MGDLIVVAAVIVGFAAAVVGVVGLFSPSLRRRLPGGDGRVPSVVVLVAGLVLIGIALGGVTG